MNDLDGRRLELRPGRTLSVAVAAPERIAQTTVLFIHGAGGRKAQWREVWPAAAEQAKLIAWDAPGHGDSPQPRRPEALAGEAWLEDAAELVRLYASGRLVIVGHSYGCRIALGLLARYRDSGVLGQVAGTLLLGPPSPEAEFAESPMATQPLWKLARMRAELERGFRMMAWSPKADRALVDAEELAAKNNRLSTMQALFRQRLPTPELGGIDTPVVILAGADDQLTPPPGAEALAGMLPRAVSQLLPDCGHQIMLEQPALVRAALAEML